MTRDRQGSRSALPDVTARGGNEESLGGDRSTSSLQGNAKFVWFMMQSYDMQAQVPRHHLEGGGAVAVPALALGAAPGAQQGQAHLRACRQTNCGETNMIVPNVLC